MIKEEIGRVKKNNITLIEYGQNTDLEHISILDVNKAIKDRASNFALEVGIVGFSCTEKELKDLHSILNYYFNIDNYSGITIQAGDNDVAIS
jgi:hypothetical protein